MALLMHTKVFYWLPLSSYWMDDIAPNQIYWYYLEHTYYTSVRTVFAPFSREMLFPEMHRLSLFLSFPLLRAGLVYLFKWMSRIPMLFSRMLLSLP